MSLEGQTKYLATVINCCEVKIGRWEQVSVELLLLCTSFCFLMFELFENCIVLETK